MALNQNATQYKALTAAVSAGGSTPATGCSPTYNVGGATWLTWQYWAEDATDVQATPTAMSLVLEARIDTDAPWVVVGDTESTAAGNLVIPALVAGYHQWRIRVTALTLGATATHVHATGRTS